MQQTRSRRARRGQMEYGPEVEDLSRRLAEWRQTRKAPARIPAELWEQAATLAGQHGVAPVAKALRLDYAALRRRAIPAQVNANRPATFLEWVAPPGSIVEGCTIDVGAGRGKRLKIEIAKLSAASLAHLIRDFVAA